LQSVPRDFYFKKTAKALKQAASAKSIETRAFISTSVKIKLTD